MAAPKETYTFEKEAIKEVIEYEIEVEFPLFYKDDYLPDNYAAHERRDYFKVTKDKVVMVRFIEPQNGSPNNSYYSIKVKVDNEDVRDAVLCWSKTKPLDPLGWSDRITEETFNEKLKEVISYVST